MEWIIGVCDDNQFYVDFIKNHLTNYKWLENVLIIHDTKPECFMKKIKSQEPQLIFLDIDMGGTSGIQDSRLSCLNQFKTYGYNSEFFW